VPEQIVSSLVLGSTQFKLPPGKITHLKNDCPAVCTELIIPENGITMFSALLHAHYRGRTLFVDMLPTNSMDMFDRKNISVVNHYSYDNQKNIPFSEPVKLYPGDEITMNCIFDTLQDTEPVHGGLGTNDEMCFAFIDYYPKTDKRTYCGVITHENFHDDQPFYACGGKFFDHSTQREIIMCDSERTNQTIETLNDITTKCQNHCLPECQKFIRTFLNDDCVFSFGVNTLLASCQEKVQCDYMKKVISAGRQDCQSTESYVDTYDYGQAKGVVIIVAVVGAFVIIGGFIGLLFCIGCNNRKSFQKVEVVDDPFSDISSESSSPLLLDSSSQ